MSVTPSQFSIILPGCNYRPVYLHLLIDKATPGVHPGPPPLSPVWRHVPSPGRCHRGRARSPLTRTSPRGWQRGSEGTQSSGGVSLHPTTPGVTADGVCWWLLGTLLRTERVFWLPKCLCSPTCPHPASRSWVLGGVSPQNWALQLFQTCRTSLPPSPRTSSAGAALSLPVPSPTLGCSQALLAHLWVPSPTPRVPPPTPHPRPPQGAPGHPFPLAHPRDAPGRPLPAPLAHPRVLPATPRPPPGSPPGLGAGRPGFMPPRSRGLHRNRKILSVFWPVFSPPETAPGPSTLPRDVTPPPRRHPRRGTRRVNAPRSSRPLAALPEGAG